MPDGIVKKVIKTVAKENPVSPMKKPKIAPRAKTKAISYNAFNQGKKNFNTVQTNRGEGFVKTVLDNANRMLDSNLGKAIDNRTGLTSLAKGFGKDGDKFTGSAFSRASQNAGYIKKNAAGEIDVNYKKIAAGYMGASTVARVATGGGLYKDGQGNTNVVGVPLI